MQRYEEFGEVLKDSNGKRRYSTMYYPKLENKTSDIYIITKSSDRLDLLSNQYYNDPRYWPIIAVANKLFSPTFRIKTGIRLRIPFPLTHNDVEDAFTNKQN